MRNLRSSKLQAAHQSPQDLLQPSDGSYGWQRGVHSQNPKQVVVGAVRSGSDMISLAQEYGWQDEWMAVTARKAKAKAPPSHNITESMAKAAGVTVQQPLVLPPVPPVQW